MITSLYPIPGGKSGKKYERLRHLPGQTAIAEPFMGGAAKSLQLPLSSYLGESNPWQRAIALASTSANLRAAYCREFEAARSLLFKGVDADDLLAFGHPKLKTHMKFLRATRPKLASRVDRNWAELIDQVWGNVDRGGAYSFCQRAAFGNVMRLNPKGTYFNVKWHVNKLLHAAKFKPDLWCRSLILQGWRPNVFNSWQDAIAATPTPRSTYLLLDPPYISDGGDKQMTPCYPGHNVTVDRRETVKLALEPLIMGCDRGFPLIHLTNYFSTEVNEGVNAIAAAAGYQVKAIDLGRCGALGNSNGRLIHGDRVDHRPAPIERLWVLLC